jgi:phage terminase large subunit GpA-like protein
MYQSTQNALEKMQRLFDILTIEKINLKVSEWAEKKRYLPEELTPDPGFWQNSRAPYLVEPMDCLSPASPITRVIIQKGTQGGWTTGIIDNFIGYTIDQNPASFMYISADQKMAEDSIDLKVDKMIDNIADLRERIKPTVLKRHNKATGDTKRKKEFPGGFLLVVGARSAGKLRSHTVKNLTFDEIDGYPLSAGAEGDPINLAEQRTKNFPYTRKIVYISTPTILQTSRICPLYDEGDKREFYIPCPKCGKYQALHFYPDEKRGNSGIHYETDDQKRLIPSSVFYKCEFCDYKIRNHEKPIFLNKGKWIPQKDHQPVDDRTRSYFWTPLLSPWHPWEAMVVSWLKADSIEKKKAFRNTELGLPWEEMGERPDIVKVNHHRRQYQSKSIPNKMAKEETGHTIEVLTVSIDTHDDSLHYEIAGWTENRNMFSIDYGILTGDTAQPEIWETLRDLLDNTEYKDDQGKIYKIVFGAIDAGGHRTTEVLDHCHSYQGYFLMPIMGQRYIIDENRKPISWQKQKDRPGYPGLRVYSINTTSYKNELAKKLKQERSNPKKQPKGYYNYPEDYPQKFFDQFTAEEYIEEKDPRTRRTKALYWRQIGSRQNHAFDLAVYNRFALEIFAEMVCLEVLGLEELDWIDFWKAANDGRFRHTI